MFLRKAYYFVKPLIPRSFQLYMRRCIVAYQRTKYGNVWPIDERAGNPPEGWEGWPGNKKFAVVLTHDVDTMVGAERCGYLSALEEKLGFRSSFNFVPRRYRVSPDLRKFLTDRGFEVGVHGLWHDGKYNLSRGIFRRRAKEINQYLKEWGAVGFRAPSMFHNLEWFHDLDIEYDASTFDTDPFEPQPDGVCTIFPFRVNGNERLHGYVELPYTLVQDFTLLILMQERDSSIWKRKLDWIVQKGGMVLLNTHPDYMWFGAGSIGKEEYPVRIYEEFLTHLKTIGEGNYWHVLPREMAQWWKGRTPEGKDGIEGRRE